MVYKRGENPRSLKNLEKGKFKPGKSGNPKGRPLKELCFTKIAAAQLSEPCPCAPGKIWAEHIVDCWLELAANNPVYFAELLNRVDGKVVQRIESEPVSFRIVMPGEHK